MKKTPNTQEFNKFSFTTICALQFTCLLCVCGGSVMRATEHLFSTLCSVMLCSRPEVNHGGNVYAEDISKLYKLEPSLTPLLGEPLVTIGQHNTASTLSTNFWVTAVIWNISCLLKFEHKDPPNVPVWKAY